MRPIGRHLHLAQETWRRDMLPSGASSFSRSTSNLCVEKGSRGGYPSLPVLFFIAVNISLVTVLVFRELVVALT